MSGKKSKSKYSANKTAKETSGDELSSALPSVDEAAVEEVEHSTEMAAEAATTSGETTPNAGSTGGVEPVGAEPEQKTPEGILQESVTSDTVADSNDSHRNAGAGLSSDEQAVVATATSAGAMQAKVLAKKEKSLSDWLPLMTLILLLLFAFIAGYFTWQFWQKNDQRLQSIESQTTEQRSQLQSQVQSQLSSSSSQQAKQLAAQKTALADLQKKITQQQKVLQQRIDSHSQRLRSLAGTSRDDWLLAEARYLLRLANQRLLMSGGTAGALGLLESADKILVSMDAPDLFPIRDAVAKDMVALKLAPSVDREGLYLQLAAIKSQLAQLPGVPLTRPESQNENTVDQEADSNTPKPWYTPLLSSVKKTFGGLDRYIRVRDHNESTEPLLTDAQQQQMTYSLHLMLEQSQLALLREEEKVYRQSLAQAITWLNTHYKHYPEKNALVEEIARLQNAIIIQQLPDISRSLEMLTDYIDRYHKVTPENKTQTKQQSSLKRIPKGESKQTDTQKVQTIPQIFKKIEKRAPPAKQGEAL